MVINPTLILSVTPTGTVSLWDSREARKEGAHGEHFAEITLTPEQLRDLNPMLKIGVTITRDSDPHTLNPFNVWAHPADLDVDPTDAHESFIMGSFSCLSEALDSLRAPNPFSYTITIKSGV